MPNDPIPSSAKPRQAIKLNMKKCVVCGAKPAGFTSYVFYESGRTKMYAPFCQQHLDKCRRFAKPVFENHAALELFKKMFPGTYWQEVYGKTLLFLDSSNAESKNQV